MTVDLQGDLNGMGHAPIGPYVIERRLATGGMAEVFLAQRKGPHGFSKRVALKRILPQYAGDPDFVSMFIDEAKLAAQLQHPNVVQVFDFGEHGGELFLAMELVEGTNVNKLLRTVAARQERLPLDIVLHIVGQTAHALAYAHRLTDDGGEPLDFVHRDVSPANILLTKSGYVKLTDFGISKVAHHTNRTEDGHVRGKLGYMSPEQAMGRAMNGQSDVFTLATVFAELLIGRPLFGVGKEIDVLVRIRDVDLSLLDQSDRLPRDVRRVLEAALERDPRSRPSAHELAEACDEVRRRRGMSHGPERLARVLTRLDLVEPGFGLGDDPGTSLIDTSILSAEAEELVRDVGATAPDIYTVRLPSGQEVGPLSFPRLVQMITGGKVHSETLIRKDRGSFAPATVLPELTRFVTSPALQWKLDELDRAEGKGILQGASLVPVVFNLMRDRSTGVLHLWDGERRKKIYFVNGRPEFVASTDRRELLGEFLVENAYCLRMEVEMGLALLPRYGGHLGDALVGLGVLRPMELFRAISAQVRQRLLEAFRWRRGRWAFVPNVRSHEETFPMGHSGWELLREAVQNARADELEAALAPLWERALRPVDKPPIARELFDLPRAWLAVLQTITPGRSAGAILTEAATVADDLEDAYRALYLGLACGFVETE